MLSGPIQVRVNNASVKVPLASAHQVILSSQAHNPLNVELIYTNVVSISKLMIILQYKL